MRREERDALRGVREVLESASRAFKKAGAIDAATRDNDELCARAFALGHAHGAVLVALERLAEIERLPRPPAPPSAHKHRIRVAESMGPDAQRVWCRCGAVRYQTPENGRLVWSEWRPPELDET